MLARLKRSHFVLLSSSESMDEGPVGPASVPIDVRLSADGLVITRCGGAEAAGVRPAMWSSASMPRTCSRGRLPDRAPTIGGGRC